MHLGKEDRDHHRSHLLALARPLDRHTRHRIEQDFHDAKAREGVDDFYGFGALEAADTYVFESLGDLRGRRVLELGCGDGETSVRLARASGSHLTRSQV